MDGTYHLRHASSLNGKVVYKKQGRGARSFYLSRDPDTLRWKVTDSEADLGTSRALLSTNEGAVLPFGSTLDWQYHQRGGFVEAPNVEVVGELPVTAAETSTSYMHSAQCGGHLESLLDRAAVQNEKMAPGGGGVAMVTWIRNKDGSKSYHVMVDNPDGEHDLCTAMEMWSGVEDHRAPPGSTVTDSRPRERIEEKDAARRAEVVRSSHKFEAIHDKISGSGTASPQDVGLVEEAMGEDW